MSRCLTANQSSIKIYYILWAKLLNTRHWCSRSTQISITDRLAAEWKTRKRWSRTVQPIEFKTVPDWSLEFRSGGGEHFKRIYHHKAKEEEDIVQKVRALLNLTRRKSKSNNRNFLFDILHSAHRYNILIIIMVACHRLPNVCVFIILCDEISYIVCASYNIIYIIHILWLIDIR